MYTNTKKAYNDNYNFNPIFNHDIEILEEETASTEVVNGNVAASG